MDIKENGKNKKRPIGKCNVSSDILSIHSVKDTLREVCEIVEIHSQRISKSEELKGIFKDINKSEVSIDK